MAFIIPTKEHNVFKYYDETFGIVMLEIDASIPPGQIWFVDSNPREPLGKIIGIKRGE